MVDMERFLSIVYFVGVICCVVYVICDPNFYLHVYLMQFFSFQSTCRHNRVAKMVAANFYSLRLFHRNI